mmetsp:Transcript_19165/g.53665  ORF Transcript_19165/g.53665 Transcript_19165/m.53665 type:complete len:421 (+) Transcript_19165:74-1336(+)
MTSFHSLPEHLVAIVYSFLPDSASRRAFFTSCRAVHSAPSVLAQITQITLKIPPEQVDAGSCNPDSNPLPFFPAAARLSTLRIQGSWSLADDGVSSRGQDDDGPRLLALLQPTREALRMRLADRMHDVEELRLEGVNLAAEAPAAAFSKLLCALCPNLRVLKMLKPGPASSTKASFLPASFLQPLSTLKLIELHMDKNVNDMHALGQLGSLQALSFSLPLSRAIPLAPLASLSALKRLSICKDDFMPVGCSLANALSGLPILEVLHLPGLPILRELQNLSPSIKMIVANHVESGDAFPELSELLSLACSGRFPMLRSIHIMDLDFSRGWDAQHAFSRVLHQASALLAPVCVTVNEVSAMDNLQSFFPVICTHADMAHGIRSFGLVGVRIEAGDLPRLAEYCPLLTGEYFASLCRECCTFL